MFLKRSQTFLNVTKNGKGKHSLYSYRRQETFLHMNVKEEQTFARFWGQWKKPVSLEGLE